MIEAGQTGGATNPPKRRLVNIGMQEVFRRLQGRWYSNSGGSRFINFMGMTDKDGPQIEYFEWHGASRMIRRIPVDLHSFAGAFSDFDEIGVQHGTDPRFLEELDGYLEKAKCWRDRDEADMVVEHFDLLRQHTDRILSDPAMRNGPGKDLYFAFAYCGARFLNVAALLGMWKAGRLQRPCPTCGRTAFCLRGACGLGGGQVLAWCPACGRRIALEGTCMEEFAAVAGKQAAGNGYRLDEIIEVLRNEGRPSP